MKNISALLAVVGAVVGCSGDDSRGAEEGDTAGIASAAGRETDGVATEGRTDTDAMTADPKLDVPGADGGDTGSGSRDCDGLVATIRDFPSSHPDFQAYAGMTASTGLVLFDLGADGTPQYNPDYDGPTMITSAETFAHWYHDVPGVNQTFEVELPLTAGANGMYTFDSDAFFPIDGQGFGNEDNAHNFHFTTQVHTSFTYEGGEIFTFRGDDDVWVFIDGRLALDLGGLHSPLEATIEMDLLGLEAGQSYEMDIFHAERHTDLSNFRIVTTIDCFVEPVG